jgi:hypothetical protein
MYTSNSPLIIQENLEKVGVETLESPISSSGHKKLIEKYTSSKGKIIKGLD